MSAKTTNVKPALKKRKLNEDDTESTETSSVKGAKGISFDVGLALSAAKDAVVKAEAKLKNEKKANEKKAKSPSKAAKAKTTKATKTAATKAATKAAEEKAANAKAVKAAKAKAKRAQAKLDKANAGKTTDTSHTLSKALALLVQSGSTSVTAPTGGSAAAPVAGANQDAKHMSDNDKLIAALKLVINNQQSQKAEDTKAAAATKQSKEAIQRAKYALLVSTHKQKVAEMEKSDNGAAEAARQLMASLVTSHEQSMARDPKCRSTLYYVVAQVFDKYILEFFKKEGPDNEKYLNAQSVSVMEQVVEEYTNGAYQMELASFEDIQSGSDLDEDPNMAVQDDDDDEDGDDDDEAGTDGDSDASDADADAEEVDAEDDAEDGDEAADDDVDIADDSADT